MKRAKLTVVPKSAGAVKDVTDRLLQDEPAKPQPKRARQPAAPRKTPPAPPQQPTQPEPLRKPATASELHTALNKTHEAVQALKEAASLPPAQFDLSIRYRLDSLRHHLEQVAEFIAGKLA